MSAADDALTILTLVAEFLIIAGFSCSIDLKLFASYVKRPKGISIGLLCQYGFSPLIAFSISKLLALHPLQMIALIITGSCPGGTFSNFWCWFFGADLSLSIAMTTASSLLSFVFLTINCFLYIQVINDGSVHIDYGALTLSVLVLLCGVIVGVYIAYKKYKKIKKIFHILGAIFLVLLMAFGALQNALISDVHLWELPGNVFLAAIMLNFAAWCFSFTFSYFIFKLERNQSIAACIESTSQNVGLAIAIVLLTMDNEDANVALGIPMLYGALNIICNLLFGTVFRLTGFIEDKKDGNFERAGFTKCIRLCVTKKITDKESAHETEVQMTEMTNIDTKMEELEVKIDKTDKSQSQNHDHEQREDVNGHIPSTRSHTQLSEFTLPSTTTTPNGGGTAQLL